MYEIVNRWSDWLESIVCGFCLFVYLDISFHNPMSKLNFKLKLFDSITKCFVFLPTASFGSDTRSDWARTSDKREDKSVIFWYRFSRLVDYFIRMQCLSFIFCRVIERSILLIMNVRHIGIAKTVKHHHRFTWRMARKAEILVWEWCHWDVYTHIYYGLSWFIFTMNSPR